MVEALAVVAVIWAAIQVVVLVTLHALPTGYDPIHDAVSENGVGPFRGWFWLQAVAGGLACAYRHGRRLKARMQ